MKKYLILTIILLLLPLAGHASLAEKLSGRILLDVEKNGEAWYIYPENNRKYFLGRPADAFAVMRSLGLGISEADFQKIAQVGMPVEGEVELAKRLSGRIIIRVAKDGEAWYVNPLDLKKYYLGRPDDAFKMMRQLGLGVSYHQLSRLHKSGFDEAIDSYSRYERTSATLYDGRTFTIDQVVIDLSDPDLRVITAAAGSGDCQSGCPAKTLDSYVLDYKGFAGINGSYFDTAAGKLNYFFAPVYLSDKDKLLNQGQLKYWTTGPVVAFDTANRAYYFSDSRDFQEALAKTFQGYTINGKQLAAAISNRPRLVENNEDWLIEWSVDEKQRTAVALRNALGYKDGKLHLVVVHGATLGDLASVLVEMGMDWALNLDGGYSSALFYNDEYMIGPGRDIPNAIIFSKNVD